MGLEGQHRRGSRGEEGRAGGPHAAAARQQGHRRRQPAGRHPAPEVRVPHALLPPDQAVQPPRHEGAEREHRGRLVQADRGAAQAALRRA